MKNLLLAVYCLLFIAYSLSAQNLVSNPSFEDYNNCPSNQGQVNRLKYWFNPTLQTPDYFNFCYSGSSFTPVSVPSNFYGFQYARTGVAYAGFAAYAGIDLREYIETSLFDTLSKGKKYCVTFYISLADSMAYATDAIGIYFSKDSIFDSTYYNLPYIPQIENPVNNIIKDSINWILIAGEYIAGGGGKFITIGNFYNDANTKIDTLGGYMNPDYWQYAYYYIDDVSVTKMKEVEAGRDTAIKYGERVQLHASGDTPYVWSPAAGLSCTACAYPFASPTVTTTYYLTSPDSNSICTSIDSVTIYVIETPCKELFIPNAFSPNGDGQNDKLYVRGNCIKEFIFAIYDRWGEKIFETSDINEGWNGKYKGIDMNSAVFVYHATGEFLNGERFNKKWNITLLK